MKYCAQKHSWECGVEGRTWDSQPPAEYSLNYVLPRVALPLHLCSAAQTSVSAASHTAKYARHVPLLCLPVPSSEVTTQSAPSSSPAVLARSCLCCLWAALVLLNELNSLSLHCRSNSRECNRVLVSQIPPSNQLLLLRNCGQLFYPHFVVYFVTCRSAWFSHSFHCVVAWNNIQSLLFPTCSD